MQIAFSCFRLRINKTSRLILLSLLTVFVTSGAVLFAQETRGSISGTVRDASGAIMPGAAIVVTNVGTNVATQITSNERGLFEVPYLVPGTYSVAARMEFRTDFINALNSVQWDNPSTDPTSASVGSQTSTTRRAGFSSSSG